MLDEIFAVPPPAFFPGLARPRTVAELAAFARRPLAETVQKLERIRTMAEDIEITPHELHELLSAKTEGLILLDVREAWEFEICKLEGSLRLCELRLGELMPRLLDAPRVVTICHHGVRSFSAAMYLRENGVSTAQSLAGGVEEWARAIDRGMPRY